MIRAKFSDSLERTIAYGKINTERKTTKTADTATTLADIELLLNAADPDETAMLFTEAARTRDEACGRRMVLRGLVEFSSYCGNTCRYCGLNRTNGKLERYRLSADEILESANLVAKAGIRTIVFQSGEDGTDAIALADIVREIKTRYDMAITLSVGERTRADYATWKDAGADRYLLRIESSDAELYASLHKGRTLATRLRCVNDLMDLGYQTGSGIMVGPPGQTTRHIARDILFFAERDFDMIGIGPFIPHPDTPFRDAKAGDVLLTLKTVALTRLVNRNAWLPATTALGSMDRDYRVDALKAGANVVMPNFSPAPVKKKYEIYPGKRCVSENTGACAGCMGALAMAAGLEIDYSRADSLKEFATRRSSGYPRTLT
jgi:biotin synthase